MIKISSHWLWFRKFNCDLEYHLSIYIINAKIDSNDKSYKKNNTFSECLK
jgi:hypothetical protein